MIRDFSNNLTKSLVKVSCWPRFKLCEVFQAFAKFQMRFVLGQNREVYNILIVEIDKGIC